MALLNALAAALFLTSCRPPVDRTPDPKVVKVRLVDSATNLASADASYLGVIRASQETDLSFKVGGILQVIGAAGEGRDWREGQEVKQGEVLAQLNQMDFASRLESAIASRDLQRKLFERAEKLLKDQAISQQDYDRIRADRIAAESACSQREQEMADSILKAPCDGHILARLVNSGETVAAGQRVLRVASMERMSVEVGVPDMVIGRIQVGQQRLFEIPALPGMVYTGIVAEVGVAAKEGVRLFKVLLEVTNHQGRIMSGMMARVPLEMMDRPPPGAVLVPMSALVARTDGTLSVFVVGSDNKAQERSVQAVDIARGHRIAGSSVVISRGVTAGERVVVAGAAELRDGAVVVARESEPF